MSPMISAHKANLGYPRRCLRLFSLPWAKNHGLKSLEASKTTTKVTAREQHEVLMAVAAAECCGRDPVAWLSSHVFMCPNSHVYFVGECGSPAQTGTCYECGAQVGGTNHILGHGNKLAQELVARIRSGASVS